MPGENNNGGTQLLLHLTHSSTVMISGDAVQVRGRSSVCGLRASRTLPSLSATGKNQFHLCRRGQTHAAGEQVLLHKNQISLFTDLQESPDVACAQGAGTRATGAE